MLFRGVSQTMKTMNDEEEIKALKKEIEFLKRKFKTNEEVLVKAFKTLREKEARLVTVNTELEATIVELQETQSRLIESEKLTTLSNFQLKASLEEIKSTQSQLIQSEKLASLGILTAGIAHEINNPINYINSSILALNELAMELIEVLDAYEALTPENINEKQCIRNN